MPSSREGGAIFAQLAHSGAVSHPDFFDGELPPAPPAVNLPLAASSPETYYQGGPQGYVDYPAAP